MKIIEAIDFFEKELNTSNTKNKTKVFGQFLKYL
jgi:hypothetical protein